MKTPQQAHDAWVASAGRAQTNYSTGVTNYNGDWAGNTTRQQSAMLTNWQTSVTSGRWAAGVQNRGTAGWKQATLDRVGNYGTGFQAGSARQQTAITKIIQAEGNLLNSLPPRGTYEQNKQRMTAMVDGLHALKGTLGA